METKQFTALRKRLRNEIIFHFDDVTVFNANDIVIQELNTINTVIENYTSSDKYIATMEYGKLAYSYEDNLSIIGLLCADCDFIPYEPFEDMSKSNNKMCYDYREAGCWIKKDNEVFHTSSLPEYQKLKLIKLIEEYAIRYTTTKTKPVSTSSNESELKKQVTKPEESKMSKTIKTTTMEMANINKQAAFNVAKITAGKALNTKLAKLVKPKLPMMLKGYADHPLFSSVIANLVAGAIKRYTDNDKANQAADAMIEAAMFQLADSFNIQETIDSFLDGFSLPSNEAKDKKTKK